MESTIPNVQLFSLTDDILLRIFALLDTQTLCTISCVCKRWNLLVNQVKNNEQQVQVADLTDEILLHIFSFLDVTSICKASQVCKNWKRIGDDENLWLYLYSKRWEAVWEIRSE